MVDHLITNVQAQQERLRALHAAVSDEAVAADESGEPDGYERGNQSVIHCLNQAADLIEEAAMRLGWTNWD